HASDPLRLLRGKVVADRAPLLAALGEAEDAVASQVERSLVVRAADERRVPVEAEARLALGRLGLEHLQLAALQIEAVELPLLRLRVDEARVVSVEDAREAVAAADVDPVGVDDPVLGGR